MLKFLPSGTIILFSLISLVKAQSPGGIPANNKMWLRSDNGVSISGSTVTQWQENSGANVTGNFTVQALAGTANVQTGPTFNPGGVNFNPYLSFDGVTNSLSSVNNFLGTALVSNANVTVFQVINLKSGVVWLKWETDQLGTTARLGFENSAGRLRFDFPRSNPAANGQNIGVTNILNKHTLSTAYVNVNTSVNRLNGADDNTIPIPGPGNFAAANTKIVLGNENLLNLPCRIDMAEVIIYSNTLTAAERNKVESYLAVKYGFTLNQLAANNNNYVATNAAITWDRALNSAYAIDITGIGRDDATALNQKQSKSVNTSALVTLYNGTYPGGVFPAENANNTNSFTNDLSFLLVGDNGGTKLPNQCALNGNAHRMQRVWKASNTGSVSPVTIAVHQDSVAPPIKNILVSADPTFPVSGTTIYPLTTANLKLFSSVTLNHNDYFTFSSDTIPRPIISAPEVCRFWDGRATVMNPISGYVYNWYNQPVGGVLVGTGVQIIIPLIQNDTTLYVETISPFNCTLSIRVPVTIRVKAVPALVVNITQPNCTINTGTVTIVSPTGPGYQYCMIGPVCQPGLTFSNLVPNPYFFAVIDATGCSSPLFFVTINPPPPKPAAPAVNAPVTICENQAATLSITNPVAGNTYNWYSASAGTVPVHTGTTFTTPFLFTPTTYYVEAVNVQGCASSRSSADVLIRARLSPPVVSVVQVTDSSILFSWPAVTGANSYSVSTNGTNYTLPSSGINGTIHLVTGLLPRTTLTLYVKAIDTLTPCIASINGTATGTTLSRYDDVYVPSAFTPNGDLLNNTLRVFGDIKTYRFIVYNRYGQLVFSTSTLNAGWDGTFKGKPQTTGTYAWFVTATLSDGRKVNLSGTTILIR